MAQNGGFRPGQSAKVVTERIGSLGEWLGAVSKRFGREASVLSFLSQAAALGGEGGEGGGAADAQPALSPGSREDGRPRREDDLAAGLKGLKLSELQARATMSGSIDEQKIVDAMDSDEPKQALALLLAESSASEAADAAQLRDELQAMKLSQLQARAVQSELAPEAIAAALDDDNPKQSLIELLLVALRPMPAAAAAAGSGLPHFGGGQAAASAKGAGAAGRSAWTREMAVPKMQHIMLSYQWDVQQTVRFFLDPDLKQYCNHILINSLKLRIYPRPYHPRFILSLCCSR
jgi:hypothetical protein